MHMADALLSPAVGGTMWGVSAGALAWSARRVRREADDAGVPLMGVLGAFVFAAQMINFSIPATGSSGHLGGGILLAILLGPAAALITIASVLVVQAVFFADGGLLALGCNIFNMGVVPALLVYPLIYRRIAGERPGKRRQAAAIMASAIVALQLGSLAVVLETVASGISALPAATFLLLMQPIHLAIGIVEGIATSAVVSFAAKARPDIVHGFPETPGPAGRTARGAVLAILAVAVLTGGVLSWFASKDPDGLEWAVGKVTGSGELKAPGEGLHGALAALQGKTAVLPDYGFRKPADGGGVPSPKKEAEERVGTSLSGLLGGLITLLLLIVSGKILRKRSRIA